jgi:hypothetical protein
LVDDDDEEEVAFWDPDFDEDAQKTRTCIFLYWKLFDCDADDEDESPFAD